MIFGMFVGYVEIIRLLINAGADLEKPDNFGSTPLHLACIYGHLNCVRILCELVGEYYCSIQVRCKILFKECNVLYFYDKLKKKLSKFILRTIFSKYCCIL